MAGLVNGSGFLDECAAFSIADLRFALAWSAVAPGFGGWRAEVVQISTGEMLDVTPPGAESPVFCVMPRAGHVEVIRERPAEAGGGQVTVARPRTLRDALLLLCPLDAACLAELDAQRAGAALVPGWG